MKTSALIRRLGRSSTETVILLVGVLLVAAFVVALVLPAVQSGRNGRRNELFNNIRSVGLAAHNVMSGAEGQFPPHLPGGTTDPDVKKPISFFTSLLPALDQPKLYDQIDKGVAWTHPKNRAAYGTRVKTFEWPEDQQPYYENEKTAAGYAIVYFSPNSRLISKPGNPFRMEDITDGTGSTVMLGTIDDSNVPAWGDPTNARDPAKGFAGGPDAFGGSPELGAHIVFADGHATTLSKNIDPKVAKALATPAGGEDVPDDSY